MPTPTSNGAYQHGDSEELMAASPHGSLQGGYLGGRMRSVSPRALPAEPVEGQGQLDLASAQMPSSRDGYPGGFDRTERILEVSLRRLDQKVAAVEAAQSRLDRRSSEASGALRGLTDEMQSQIRRFDGVEARLMEFRSQLESDLRARFSQVDAQRMDVLTKCRSMITVSEDGQRRVAQTLRRLEGNFQGCAQQEDALAQALAGMQERLDSVEEHCLQAAHERARDLREEQFSSSVQRAAPAAERDEEGAGGTRIWGLERQLAELGRKVEQLFTEAHGDRGWQERLEEHEVRLAGIRSKLEGAPALAATAPGGSPGGSPQGGPPGGGEGSRSLDVPQASEPDWQPVLATVVDQLRALAPKVIEHEGALKDLAEQLRQTQFADPRAPLPTGSNQAMLGLNDRLAHVERQLRDQPPRAPPAGTPGLDALATRLSVLERLVPEKQAGADNQLGAVLKRLAAVEKGVQSATANSGPGLDETLARVEAVGAGCLQLQQQLRSKMYLLEETIQSVNSAVGVAPAPSEPLAGQQPGFANPGAQAEPGGWPGGSRDPVDQELTSLNKRIMAGETECSQLQQTLGDKISKLDELMKKVGAAVT